MTNQNEPNFIRPGMSGDANPEHTSAQRRSHHPGVGEAFQQQPGQNQDASMQQEGRSFARQDEILDSPLDEPARHNQIDMQQSPDPAQARFEAQTDPTLAQGREQIINQYRQGTQEPSSEADAYSRRDPDWQNKP